MALGKFNSREIEERVLQWWEDEHIYELVKKAEPKNKKFFFLDGPPYTTGDVHLGTAWNKVMKDMVIKYKRMRGYRVTDTPGYDTHGLPIEVVIEKQLGIKDKQEILKFGMDKFIKECRSYAEGKIGDMNDQFKRLGCTFWNWENPYVTLTNTYIQGIWWTLKKAWENGYLYKFYKPQNCCPRCATALAKHEFEYENIIDNAIFVKFRTVEDPKKFYIIWTTTPWTLVANTNIMANPETEYVEMRVKDETWIMATAATASLLQMALKLEKDAPDGFSYGKRMQGYDLEGKKYIHPLADEVPRQAELEEMEPKVHSIVLSREYVQETGGSGLVHSAPGHGPEDFEVGMEYGIPVFSPVDMKGTYTEEGGKYEGQFVHDTNQEIIDLLIEKGTLVNTEEIEHEYAHCWRCKSKLVYRATEQWFFKTSSLRDEMLDENEQIYWVPKRAGQNSFKSWLMNLQDWCISRQRFWGIPLSIWTCDDENCDTMDVIGSKDELKEKSGECPEDLHRPFIDNVTWKCPKCKKGTMRRIPDILDVWLDSGSVMWASQQFVDGHEHYDTWEAADFIIEGKDQIRGWFNSLLCSAMVSSQRRNYDVCYMHGWVNSHGIKMSKSLGNAITPQDIIEGKVEILTESQKTHLRKQAALSKTSKFDKAHTKKSGKKKKERKKKYICDDKRWSNVNGIETFRFFSIMGTPAGKDLNFDYKEYTDTFKTLNTLWNSYLFAQEKMDLHEFNPAKHKIAPKTLSPADKWILSRTNSLVVEITDLYEKYFLYQIPQRLQDYILMDLSRWYITNVRDVLDINSEDPGRFNTLATLWEVLKTVTLLLAPINPMLTEEIYQNFITPKPGGKTKKSIHLEKWPKAKKKYIDEALETSMSLTRQIIEAVRSLKTEAKIKLRWPSKALYILQKEDQDDTVEIFQDLVLEMSNVKVLKVVSKAPKGKKIVSAEVGDYTLYLDLADSKALQQERIIRDLYRTLQTLRKSADLQTGEPITMELGTEDAFILKALESFKEAIGSKVTADPLTIVKGTLQSDETMVSHKFHVCLNGTCYAMIKSNFIKKMEAGKTPKCGYCQKEISKDHLGVIEIQFKKN